jgi:hypothetical protein
MTTWVPSKVHSWSGSVVTSFEPGAEWDRAGSRPDQFLPQMRAAGLAT